MKRESEVIVKNDLGLHTRPATVIVKMIQNCDCCVEFTYNKQTINAKSILSILMLAAPRDSRLKITVDGNDADQVMKDLVNAFEREFDER